MVLLHSAYGNFPEAAAHAGQFPARADFNVHVMYAYYAHWKRDYKTEAKSCQYGFLHYFEGMLNIMTRLAKCYEIEGNYKDAEITLNTALGLIGRIFAGEDVVPPVHYREQGDMYMLLAGIYLKDGDRDSALLYLEKMVDYDMNEYAKLDENISAKSPLLSSIPQGMSPYLKRVDRYQELLSKLTDARFDALSSDERYMRLLDTAGAKR